MAKTLKFSITEMEEVMRFIDPAETLMFVGENPFKAYHLEQYIQVARSAHDMLRTEEALRSLLKLPQKPSDNLKHYWSKSNKDRHQFASILKQNTGEVPANMHWKADPDQDKRRERGTEILVPPVAPPTTTTRKAKDASDDTATTADTPSTPKAPSNKAKVGRGGATPVRKRQSKKADGSPKPAS